MYLCLFFYQLQILSDKLHSSFISKHRNIIPLQLQDTYQLVLSTYEENNLVYSIFHLCPMLLQ